VYPLAGKRRRSAPPSSRDGTPRATAPPERQHPDLTPYTRELEGAYDLEDPDTAEAAERRHAAAWEAWRMHVYVSDPKPDLGIARFIDRPEQLPETY